MSFKLYAERGEVGERRLIGEFHSLTAVANKIEKMDDDEEWPEGFEAVAVRDDGAEWLFSDEWEKVK